jgi:hypothetical protein
MDFTFPERDEVAYRIWRLRRLIVCAAVVPVVVSLVAQTLAWPFIGAGPVGLVPLFVVSLALIAAHAVLFPAVPVETMTLSLGLSFLALVEPLIGANLILRVLELLVFAAIVLFSQPLVLRWQAASRPITASFRASVTTEHAVAQARAAFAPGPGMRNANVACGQADASGLFPVLPGLGPQSGTAEAAHNEADTGPDPTLWAKIIKDTDDARHIRVYETDETGKRVPTAVCAFSFKAMPEGCRVTEVETVEAFPVGQAAGMWLTDYQRDSLIHIRDGLEGRTTMAIRAVSDASLLTLLGAATGRRGLPTQDVA